MAGMMLSSLRENAPNATITVLFKNPLSQFVKAVADRLDIKVSRGTCDPDPVINHFNVYFKLYNLSRISESFLFIDADTLVLSPLEHLWNLTADKPWVAVNHRRLPRHCDGVGFPFLNSGVQVVHDPDWYDLDRIVTVYRQKNRLLCPGRDQALLFGFCRDVGYDYTHQKAGHGWNTCAGYSSVERTASGWKGMSIPLTGESEVYPVHVNHYWGPYKPWRINCPAYSDFRRGFKEEFNK